MNRAHNVGHVVVVAVDLDEKTTATGTAYRRAASKVSLALDGISPHPLRQTRTGWEDISMTDAKEFARELAALIKRYIDGGCDPQEVADELARESNYVFGHYNLEIYLEKRSKD